MKIVYLTSRFPHPLDRGDKLRAYHQIKELSRYHEIHLISISDDEVSAKDKQALSGYCASIDIHILSDAKRLINMMRDSFSSLPFQVSYFYDAEIKRYIDLIVNEIGPDHIFCQTVRMAPYALDFSVPKSIDYMDCLSANWSQYGAPATKYLPFVRGIEQKRLRRYEQSIAPRFDHRFVISARDHKALGLSEKVIVTPNGVDIDFFAPSASIVPDFDFVFCGNLGYVHNQKAAHYIMDEITPIMQEDNRMLISGARPPGWLRIKQSTKVTVEGYAEDVRHHYQRGRVMIAPIYSGSGLQNKILEAMAQGIPCVTTPFVNEAIGAEHGVHLYVADTPRGLLSYAEGLIAKREEYAALSISGRSFVEKNYQWSNAIAPLLDAFAE